MRRSPTLPDGFAAWRAEHHLFRKGAPRQHTHRHVARAFSFEGGIEHPPPRQTGQGAPMWGFLDWLEGFRGKLFWQPYQPRRRVIVLERNFVIEDDELEQSA